MTTAVIITVCLLLLLAYIFDLSSVLTRIPSVILLLFSGWIVRQFTILLNIGIPDLHPLLPVLGTIGLILIVLEGALELEFNKSKIKVINKSLINALLPMIFLAFIYALAFQYFANSTLKNGLINAIPFCVISSAIAIPASVHLSRANREFIIYESSLSDITGVLFFNFIALNELFNVYTFGHFTVQLVVLTIISFITVLALSFFMSRINHHITYSPIILIVILFYAVSKVYHLPGLIFILVFGLFLGNLETLKKYKWIEKLRPEKLEKEVRKFKEITGEATFLVRALFFLVFGFLLEAREIIYLPTLPWALVIVATSLFLRWVILQITNLPVSPLLFIAPRGLITVLLFLSIIPGQSVSVVNNSLVVQVIILSVLVMMVGLMTFKRDFQV